MPCAPAGTSCHRYVDTALPEPCWCLVRLFNLPGEAELQLTSHSYQLCSTGTLRSRLPASVCPVEARPRRPAVLAQVMHSTYLHFAVSRKGRQHIQAMSVDT